MYYKDINDLVKNIKMKLRKLILIVLLLTGYSATAQDLIIKMDKKEVKAKVLEVAEDVIKYKKFEKLDGPTYSIKREEVFMIIYKDGTKEYMLEDEINTHSILKENYNLNKLKYSNFNSFETDLLFSIV